MNSDRDFNRLLDQWFADGPREVSDRVVVEVADRIERQSQRPAWRFPGRHFQVNLKLQWIAAAAAVLIVAVFAGRELLAPAPNSGVGGASPTPSASPDPNFVHATAFGVPLSLTLSGGWTRDGIERTNLDLQHGDVDLGFHPMSSVTLPGATVADPWIPVPADFVAWIAQRPEFVASAPRTITIAGRSGTVVDADFVWKAGTAKRDFLRYTTGAWLYDQGDDGNRVRFIIVPASSGVGGIVIVMNARIADFASAAAALDVVLATVQFDGPGATPAS